MTFMTVFSYLSSLAHFENLCKAYCLAQCLRLVSVILILSHHYCMF